MRTEHSPLRHQPSAFSILGRSRPAANSLVLPAALALIAIAWTVAWVGPEPVRWYTFFPLWFGYILAIDGLNHRRSGHSYLTSSPRQFVGIFAISMPLWWIFEALNLRLNNWTYHLPLDYPPLVYALLASIAFSTVVPAVLETAALYQSSGISWMRVRSRPRDLNRRILIGATAAGLVMFALVVLFPRQAFPLTWLSLFFVIDPINAHAGRPSLIVQAASGRWSTIVSLGCAGLTCGLFWELWNYWSMPKWTYDVPYVGAIKLFEMPILGYGGYIPFAFEIFALVSLASGWIPSMRAILPDDASD